MVAGLGGFVRGLVREFDLVVHDIGPDGGFGDTEDDREEDGTEEEEEDGCAEFVFFEERTQREDVTDLVVAHFGDSESTVGEELSGFEEDEE